MPVPHDDSPELKQYAHPERLVTTQWLADNLDNPDLVVVESDEDVLLYDTGHIPGAVKVDWHLDLNDPVTRDYVDGEGFSRLCAKNGISRDSTVVRAGALDCGFGTNFVSLRAHPRRRALLPPVGRRPPGLPGVRAAAQATVRGRRPGGFVDLERGQ